jgi:tRNA dimethylallyltransferase
MAKNIIITGPTATGKTKLAVFLAKRFNGEIISADSRQVYRHLDIGTGKDIEEYGTGTNAVPYHLIDIVGPDAEYNLMRFRQDAPVAINDIHSRGHLPIISGGTPLYIDSLISDYKLDGGASDKNLRTSLKKKEIPGLLEILKENSLAEWEKLRENPNRNRIIRAIEKTILPSIEDPVSLPENTQWLIIGVFFHRKEVHKRIEARLNQRLEEGMVEEAEKLHSEYGLSWERMEFLGLEYRYLAYYLQNKMSYEEMHDKLLIKIRQFAKRQDIWFRKMEREGHTIHWIPEGEREEAAKLAEIFLNNSKLPEPKIKISDINYGNIR